MIEQYRDSEYSRDVLDAFLSRFDLDPYQPRVKVTYTITGSFEVDSDDVDGAVEYSDNFDVTVRSVEPVDD